MYEVARHDIHAKRVDAQQVRVLQREERLRLPVELGAQGSQRGRRRAHGNL